MANGTCNLEITLADSPFGLCLATIGFRIHPGPTSILLGTPTSLNSGVGRVTGRSGNIGAEVFETRGNQGLGGFFTGATCLQSAANGGATLSVSMGPDGQADTIVSNSVASDGTHVASIGRNYTSTGMRVGTEETRGAEVSRRGTCEWVVCVGVSKGSGGRTIVGAGKDRCTK